MRLHIQAAVEVEVPDEIAEKLVDEAVWNDPLIYPEEFDELRQIFTEVMSIEEIRVEKVVECQLLPNN